jgi:hypothetical protein
MLTKTEDMHLMEAASCSGTFQNDHTEISSSLEKIAFYISTGQDYILRNCSLLEAYSMKEVGVALRQRADIMEIDDAT